VLTDSYSIKTGWISWNKNMVAVIYTYRKEKLYAGYQLEAHPTSIDHHCRHIGSGNTETEASMNFIDELLAQAEVAEAERRLEMNKQQANHILAAIAVLEGKQAEVESLVSEEMRLLTEYRENEVQRLQKKIRWLAWNLEQFMREHNTATQDKTLTLPKGQLKLRQSRGTVDIVDIDLFMKSGTKLGLVRTIPERYEPDLQAVMKRIITTGEVVPGTSYQEGVIKFSYTTKGNGNGTEQR
jgi:hypothetical protein